MNIVKDFVDSLNNKDYVIMSHTKIHKLEGKFKNKILPYGNKAIDTSFKELGSKYPLIVRKKWDRHNFDIGYYRNLKNKKADKILSKEFYNQLQNNG